MSTSPLRNRYFKENISAILVALVAAAVVYLGYDPIPAGSSPDEVVDSSAEALLFVDSRLEVDSEVQSESSETALLNGRDALLKQTRLLEQGLRQIETLSDYSAKFAKQERIEGVMTEPIIMEVKIRQEPFAIYMKWLKGDDVGRQVAYVDGENNNRMMVKFGGVKGRMIPTLKLNPMGEMAMSEARYPITEMGLKKMIERILEFRYRDLKLSQGVECRMLDARMLKHKDCCCFEINYDAPDVSPKFRKSYIHICKETCLPIFVKNFGWPLDGAEAVTGKELDEQTLLECYSYSDISTDSRLSTGAFELADTGR